MRFSVQIECLRSQEVVLVINVFGKPKLFVNEQEFASKKNRFAIDRAGQAPIYINMKSRFFDPVPNLEVDGSIIEIAPAFKWYQYTWCCLPLVLLLFGGAIGGAIGGAASFFNAIIFRSQSGSWLQYLLTGLVSAFSMIVYLIIAVIINIIIGR